MYHLPSRVSFRRSCCMSLKRIFHNSGEFYLSNKISFYCFFMSNMRDILLKKIGRQKALHVPTENLECMHYVYTGHMHQTVTHTVNTCIMVNAYCVGDSVLIVFSSLEGG